MKKYYPYLLFMVLVLVIGAGCSTSTGNDNGRPRANAGTDATGAPGEAVAFDGSLSSDSDGDSLSYRWSIVSMPGGSEAVITDSTSMTAAFTPDLNGEYVIRLTVSDGGRSSSDDVKVTVTDGNNPQILTGTVNIPLDERFANSASIDYRLQGIVTINSVINVGPGVRIEAAPGSRLVVAPGGRLVAVGITQPIIIRGASNAPGSWDGLVITSSEDSIQLRNVTIGEGGGHGFANVAVRENGNVGISFSNFVNSSTYGITVAETCSLHAFSTNTFSNNRNGAISLFANHVDELDVASDYNNNNGEFPVIIQGGTINSETGFRVLNVPYFINGNITIRDEVNSLGGAEFIFAGGRSLVVQTGGSLQAIGGVFRGAQDTRGFWGGITFQSDDADNELRNVTVTNGGGNNFGNVYIAPGGRATINGGTYSSSSRYGIYVAGTATLVPVINYGNNASGDLFQQ